MALISEKTSINNEKYLNSLVYFISHCDNEKLGLTKLNKLFYYLDFISFRDQEKSVTGETYVHLPMGPLASHLEQEIQKAEKEKVISHKKSVSSKFGKRNRYQAKATFDASVFDSYELNLLEQICQTFKDWTTDQMIAQTHSEAPWVFSEPSKPLNYEDSDDIGFFVEDAAVV